MLGGHGKQLHTHEIHVRRTDGKGYIAKHDLVDKHGNPPQDGQKPNAEYPLMNKAEMLQHVEQHMGNDPDQEEDDEAGQ